jgi:glycosyltransferase involved in cell wall biosynthesis
VSNDELVKLYSNALYVLFTFTHEPFGYIPIESMACGTPVLTYNVQGPSESVIDGSTGWLANDDEELTALAVQIWKDGYSPKMRSKCIERAAMFDLKNISEQWLQILKEQPH